MTRPVTLFTGQWADLALDELCEKAKTFGYDGLELACWGDHFEVEKADQVYCQEKKATLDRAGLRVFAVSSHLVGQAVCDRIDARHREILPDHIWGDGEAEGVRQRAAREMIKTARAAAAFGVDVVNGFTGSSIWHLLYAFPPVSKSMIDEGYRDFAGRWNPILDAFHDYKVRFALEVHPTEIAFDIASAERALQAVGHHPSFGFNFDPSHLGYQGVDYVAFLRRFHDRIFHVHIKDAGWSDTPCLSGVFGGHLSFGDPRRYWDFRSP
ncbi:MAG: sugar phosphate isomerase/epimerase, partial [Planctomycetes bacterium]|nr:sugar phosphate isomerase/epimerase [Planctomycetota bacterium]